MSMIATTISSAPSPSNRQHFIWIGLVALVALPFIAQAFGLDYYIGFARRILIVAIAAMTLDFLLGLGGMPSLGQAAFLGVGAYTAAAVTEYGGITSFWALSVMCIVTSAAVAGLMGLIALRTRGTYFIMITLALAQMIYYFAVSLRPLGGDDGYTLKARPVLGWNVNIDNTTVWYMVVLGVALAVLTLLRRIAVAPFGRALAGVRENEVRMSALGYPVLMVKLVAFVIAGSVTGLAGFLLLVDNRFFSPSSMHWTQSAMLLVMVVLGGAGRMWGALLGVAVWLIAEEWVRQYTSYWHWPLGVTLILVMLFAPKGLVQLAQRRRHGD